MEACISGLCMYVGCSNDAECGQGMRCEPCTGANCDYPMNGQCVPAEACSVNEDCQDLDPNWVCHSTTFTCGYGVECEDNTVCGPGEYCACKMWGGCDGTCEPDPAVFHCQPSGGYCKPAQEATPCDPGFDALSGRPDDCGQGFYCCAPAPTSCQSDIDCAMGEVCQIVDPTFPGQCVPVNDCEASGGYCIPVYPGSECNPGDGPVYTSCGGLGATCCMAAP
jgi:hypothetical protein